MRTTTPTVEELRRTPPPNGELADFVLDWEERGIPHACHQAHVLTLGTELSWWLDRSAEGLDHP